jgi:hypothetical protein
MPITQVGKCSADGAQQLHANSYSISVQHHEFYASGTA